MLVEELNLHNGIPTSRALQQYIFRLLQKCKPIEILSQIHSQIVINGFTQKNYILAKLLSFYIASGHLYSAHQVFKDIQTPTVALWNQMIKGYARSGSPRMAIVLFNQMGATEVEPDRFTYSLLLSGCARSGLLREGEQVHGRVLMNGHCSNVFVKTNLVNLYAMVGTDYGVAYARRVFDEMRESERNSVSWDSMLAGYMRCGDVDRARKVFHEMPERNVVSWTTMIAGYAKKGKCKRALRLFNQMRGTAVGLDQVALVAALSACAELGDLRLGRWIHSYIDKNLIGKSHSLLISLNNALIHMYASCGVIEEAYEVFRRMPERSRISWTAMITAFAKQGYAQDALYIFELMQSLGVKEAKPDAITFIGVLCACSHAGLVDEGCQFFMDMIQIWGIKPTIEHYGCMVDLLSRAGLLNEAYDLIESMPMKPNDVIWGALLGGCRLHKNAVLASHVARKLVVELDPDKAAGYLMLVAQVYATAQRWQDFASVKEKMVEMGERKPAGRSYVQVNGVVHDFVAGDRTHKLAPLIYEMLGKISQQVDWVSCQPDTREVPSVVDG